MQAEAETKRQDEMQSRVQPVEWMERAQTFQVPGGC
jgi:hypothetical protein